MVPGEPPPSTIAKGWTTLQPLSPTISYKASDQNFTAAFNNAMGTSITIEKVNITELRSSSNPQPCNGEFSPAFGTLGSSPVKVPPGSDFEISALCPGANRKRNDPYELKISIGYSTVNGGIETLQEEIGSVRGIVE